MKALIPVLLGVLSVAMVARSLWSVQVPKILRPLSGAPVPCSGRQMSGGFNAAPWSAMDEEKDYQDMICLGRKGDRFSQGEKGPEPFSPWDLLGSFA